MHPYEKKFIISKGIEVDEDLYALADLIQWIWCSGIHEGEVMQSIYYQKYANEKARLP